MSDGPPQEPIRIALALADPVLCDQLAAILANAPSLILVSEPDGADAVLAAPCAPAARDGNGPLLTPREQQVVSLLAEGASNKTIAQSLGISVHTAKFHVSQVIDKLDAIGRTDAVAQAARIGVIRL